MPISRCYVVDCEWTHMAAKNTGFVLSLHVCIGGTRVELMSLSTASFTSTCHIKRGKHCVEPKQFSGLTRQDNRETPCELRYSFPVLPSVFTPASINNLWRPWISQRHNSPTLLFTAWGHALQQTPPLAHVNDYWGPSGLQTYNKMMCGEMESTQPGSESLQKRGD